MATLDTRLARTRTLNYVDDNQYTDTNAILDINSLIREAILLKKPLWDIGKDTFVEDQNEYRVEDLVGSPDLEILNISKLQVKYATDNDFVPCTYIPYQMFDNNTTSTEMYPIYYTKDDSVFVFPAPDANITDGIQIDVKYLPAPVALTDNDTDIRLSSAVVDLIFNYGLTEFIELEKGNKVDAQNAKADYLRKLQNAIGNIGYKVTDTKETRLPKNINSLI